MSIVINWKPRKHSLETYEKIRDLHLAGVGANEINTRLGIGVGTAYDVLKRLGIMRSRSEARTLEWRQGKHRNPHTDGFSLKYSYDEDLFKKDTPDMAWVLGLILSDGHVRRNNWCVSASEDICRKLLGITKGGQLQKRPNINVHYAIISNLKMCEDLRARFGIEHNKCTKLKFVNLQKTLMPHFIRGFWDGDGSFSSVLPKGRNVTRFTASLALSAESFIKDLFSYLKTEKVVKGGCIHSCINKNSFSKNLRHLLSFGIADSLSLSAWFYKDSKESNRGDLNYTKWINYQKDHADVFNRLFLKRNAV
jgi:hypothetical protein